MDAVLYASMSLEALVNDIPNLRHPFKPENDHPKVIELCEILEELEESRASVRLKYKVFALVFTGNMPSKEDPVFREFNFLMELRNELAHPKPTIVEIKKDEQIHEPKRYRRIIEEFRKRGLILKIQERYINDWKSLLNTYETALWSYLTVVNFVEYLRAITPDSEFKRRSFDAYFRDYGCLGKTGIPQVSTTNIGKKPL
jgi:hypothetical protein